MKTTFFRPLVLLSLLILSPFTPAKAQADLDKIKVITSFYEPYSFKRGEQVEGEAVAQARHLFKELDFHPTINIYPWPRAYELALNQPNVLLFSVARTPQREDLFHWVGEIVGFNVFLYRNAKRDDIQVHNLQDAGKYRVGALNKDVKGQYLREQGIDAITLNNEENGIQMVLSNRIDMVPMDKVSMQHRLHKNRLKEDSLVPAFKLEAISKPLYIAFSRGTDPEIVQLFQDAHKRAFPTPENPDN